MRTGDFRRAFVEGPSEQVLRGPVLTGVRYPDVLVARAFSHGDDLELVLYSGREPGRQSITIERLSPGRPYTLTSGTDRASLVADNGGRISTEVVVDGRTPLALTPA